MGAIIYQILVYTKSRRIKFKNEPRLWIFYMSLVFCLNVLFHYGLTNPYYRVYTYNMIEFQRFIIMFSIMIFYVNRLHRMLTYLKQVIGLIAVFGFVYVIFYVIVEIMILQTPSSSFEHCNTWMFQMLRIFPSLIVIFFVYIYFDIKKKVKNAKIERDIDRSNQAKQLKEVNKLKKVLILYGIIIILLVVTDLISQIRSALSDTVGCNNAYIQGTSGRWLNGLIWLITRLIAAVLSQVVCIYLFRKSWLKGYKKQKRRSTLD